MRSQFGQRPRALVQKRRGLVQLRRVYVEDRQGTHRPDYLFSIDPTMPQRQILEYYTLRWSIENDTMRWRIETTFQGMLAHLDFETTRHWSPSAVERVEPWLLALFSLVSLLHIRHMKRRRNPRWPWYQKEQATIADALTLVRRQTWMESAGRGSDNRRTACGHGCCTE